MFYSECVTLCCDAASLKRSGSTFLPLPDPEGEEAHRWELADDQIGGERL